MAETNVRVEQYLQELASSLEVLGAAEVGVVVAEMRADLTEAVADAGGDSAGVLAGYGPAGELAKGILDERGFVVTEGRGPRVSRTRVWLSIAVDVLLWAAAVTGILMFLVGLSFILTFEWDLDLRAPMLQQVLAFAPLVLSAVVAFWHGGRVISARRKVGAGSLGMLLVDLRRVRLGDQTALVRSGDIAGTRRPAFWIPGLVTAAAALLLIGSGYNAATSVKDVAAQQSAYQMTHGVQLSGDAVRIVTLLYRNGFEGNGDVSWLAEVSSAAQSGIDELNMRAETARTTGYSIDGVQVAYFMPEQWPSGAGDPTSMEVYVRVHEYRNDSVDEFTAYEWHLTVRSVGDSGPGAIEGSGLWWTLDGVEKL